VSHNRDADSRSLSWSGASVGRCVPTLAAIAARGISPVSPWSVMPYPHPPRQQSCHGGCYPAPLHAVRVLTGIAPTFPLVTLSRSLPGRSRRSAPLPPSLRACHAACLSSKTRTATRHAKPSARRLRARLDAGLGKVRRCLPRSEIRSASGGRAACARPAGAGLRFPPPAWPPSAGVRAERAGRSAAVLR